MFESCLTLPRDSVCNYIPDKEFEELTTENFELESNFEVPSTKASVSLRSSISLIRLYCSKLPRNIFSNFVPEFEVTPINGMFKATLKLPSNCPIKSLHGQIAKTKILARQSAALQTCKALYKAKQLDDNLLPVDKNAIDERDFQPMRKDNIERKSEEIWRINRNYTSKIPDFWHSYSLETYFINYIDVSEISKLFNDKKLRPHAFITKQKLPVFNPQIFYSKSFEAQLKINSINVPTILCNSEVKQLTDFTLYALFTNFGKEFQIEKVNPLYFIVPFKEDCQPSTINKSLIDWDLLANISQKHIPCIHDVKIGSIIINKISTGYRYCVKKIREDLNSDSIIPNTNGIRDKEIGETFKSYYKRQNDVIILDDQVVYEVEQVFTTLDFLKRDFEQFDNKEKSTNFIISQYCSPFLLPEDVLLTSMLIPSILIRLDSLLLVKEVKNKLLVPEIKDEVMLEAFTLPSAGVAINYERLEFLGDSFLKLITSINLYINFPLKAEGQLHCRRLRIVENKFLYHLSRNLNLSNYVTHRVFSKSKYCPNGFNIKGVSKPFESCSYTMSGKVLADIVEAILGAGVLTGKEHGGLKCAIALGIPLEGFSDWQSIRNLKPTPILVDTDTVKDIIDFETIETIIGYKFKDPIWLAEAFTHPSQINPSTPYYQRLEFLGDAILDYFVTFYLFEKYPSYSDGDLTISKAACVSNSIFGAIVEQLDLYKYILHSSNFLKNDIQQYVDIIRKMRDDGKIGDQKDYWHNLKVPKAISDVLEASLGAVFIDSGFDIPTVYTVFESIIKPFYDQHLIPIK